MPSATQVRLGAMDLSAGDVNKLLSLDLEAIKDRHGDQVKASIMKKSVFLYYTNLKKDIKNMEMLGKLASTENPVAIVRPRVSGPRAGKSIASHFPKNQPLRSAFICIGARVAINSVNYYPMWGLYNGACGVIIEIVFSEKGANPNDGGMPDYVVVDFPNYKGPAWDMSHPTHVPIPRSKILCNKGCCSREGIPLVLAWAITVHRFQGQSAGPVDAGKIPNPYECIVCDPHDMGAETKHLGVLYTALSRATTLGDRDGLNSAFYFISNCAEERFRCIGRKKGSTDYYESYIKRSRWVRKLHGNTYQEKLTYVRSKTALAWAKTARCAESAVEKLVVNRQLSM